MNRLFRYIFFVSLPFSFFVRVQLVFHTISTRSFFLIYIYVPRIEKFSCIQRKAACSSSLQLPINYRELKQLKLPRYTINERTLHDATHRQCNLLQCKHPFCLLFLSQGISLHFPLFRTHPRHTPLMHTLLAVVGAGFPVH